jgi:hypothetical protein
MRLTQKSPWTTERRRAASGDRRRRKDVERYSDISPFAIHLKVSLLHSSHGWKIDDLTSPSKIASTVVSVLNTHWLWWCLWDSNEPRTWPSPGAALFGFDIKSTAENKNLQLTKAGKTNKGRRTNYASISRVTQDPVFCYNETCDTTKLFPPHPFFMSASNFYSYLLIPLDVQSTFCSIKCVFNRGTCSWKELI